MTLTLRTARPWHRESPAETFRREHAEYPREISIETMALCNARCTFCPYPTMDRKGTKMPDELLNKLIDEMIEWNRPLFFSPFKVNEPFLDARVLPLLERLSASAPKIVMRIFTNGSPLTVDKIDRLAKLKRVAHLWISLNSHIPEEYEQIMGLDFEQTAKKIDALHARNFPHKVMLSTVGFPNEDFRRYCFERWPDFESLAIKKDSWLGFTDPQYEIEVPDKPCTRWFELSIMATGKVAHCCMHDGTDERFNIGNLNQQTMLEVYNSQFWRERRMQLQSRKALDSRSPCANCSY